MRKRLLTFMMLVAIAFALPSFAVEPDEMLDDPVLEARAREISKKLRCVVCQNQDIDNSAAGVARDLRILLRERLVAGDTDQQAIDFIVARYGEFVLFKPPWKKSTYLLWVGPFAILALGGLSVVVLLARRPRRIVADQVALSTEDEKTVAEFLADREKGIDG